MNDAINERLIEFIESLGIQHVEFANKIGVTRQQLWNWTSNSVKIPTHCLTRIAEVYETLNMRWLICGQGCMVCENNCVTSETIKLAKDYSTESKELIYDKLSEKHKLEYAELLHELSELKIKYVNLLEKTISENSYKNNRRK